LFKQGWEGKTAIFKRLSIFRNWNRLRNLKL